MNKNILMAVTLALFLSVVTFSGIVSFASEEKKEEPKAEHGEKKEGPGEKKEEAAKEEGKGEKSAHGEGEKKEENKEPEKPKVAYKYFPDVHSLDDLKEPIQTENDPNVKVVYQTPDSCKDFSLYLETKYQKLQRFEAELNQRERLLTKMQTEFDNSIKRYAETETRVKELVNADPTNLKNNPELAKIIKLFESISAEEASERLKNLDLDLTLAILKGMQPKKLSKVMTALDPKLSAALSGQMVRGF